PLVEVAVSVMFNEEERLIIQTRQLEDFVVLERGPDARRATEMEPEEFERWAHKFHLRIGHLASGETDRFACTTPAEAKSYHQRLVEALKQLKVFLLANAELEPAASFEL